MEYKHSKEAFPLTEGAWQAFVRNGKVMCTLPERIEREVGEAVAVHNISSGERLTAEIKRIKHRPELKGEDYPRVSEVLLRRTEAISERQI